MNDTDIIDKILHRKGVIPNTRVNIVLMMEAIKQARADTIAEVLKIIDEYHTAYNYYECADEEEELIGGVIQNLDEIRKKIKALSRKGEGVVMAYYCKLCQCWHYPGSKYYYLHRIYSSQRHTPRQIVSKRRKGFWDNW